MNQEQMDEIKRHVGVVVEGLRNDIRQVAEGVVNLDEKFDREMTSLREENEQAHREILSAIKFSYAERDQRIRESVRKSLDRAGGSRRE